MFRSSVGNWFVSQSVDVPGHFVPSPLVYNGEGPPHWINISQGVVVTIAIPWS